MPNVRTRKMSARCRNRWLAPQRSIESLETRALLAADVVISEFMASNTETLADSQGQYHDWVELHNRGDVEVDLERWTLRDRGAQFQMPKVVLGPDEYLVLFASGSQRIVEEPFEIHTNFRLARTGEYLGLSDPAGVVVSEFNPFPSQDDDISYGLSHDDVFPQFFQQPTPGSQNASAPNVYISEFMAVNQNTLTDEDGDFADWIELHNAGDSPANLEGWKLVDSSDDWEFGPVTIPPNDYLVVFATGNDRRDPAGELHTNFKLGGNGDSLRLLRPDGNYASSFRSYPPQTTDVSYGLPTGIAEPQFFQSPTPGTNNTVGDNQVRFSSPSGFYNDPVLLTLSAEDPNVEIRYTTDGAEPTGESPIYVQPLQIVESSVVRAAAFTDGQAVNVATRSYLLTPSILRQNGIGRPQTWGAVSDYDMDPEVVGNGLSGNAFSQTPALSISVDPDDLFSIADGIFAHPLMEGAEWKRRASVEVIGGYVTRSTGPLSATLSTTGENDERNPAVTSKFSMQIALDELLKQDGVSLPLLGTERSLDQITLRAGHADSWLADESTNRDLATYGRDRFLLQTQRDMGQPALGSQTFNVFMNGLYWGTYTATETPSQHTFSEHVGGIASNFDLFDQHGLVAGEATAWERLMALAQEDLRQADAFAEIASLVDIENLMDFVLLKKYAGIGDAAEESWVAGRDRTGTKGFQFIMHSNERSLGIEPTAIEAGVDSDAPSFLFDQLIRNEQFLRDFADRANHHVTTGALSDSVTTARWNSLQVGPQAAFESARWGDYRRDANPRGGDAQLYGIHNINAAVESVRDYVNGRAESLQDELQDAGLFTEVPPPEFSPNRVVVEGSGFTITTPSGEIYYTTDGTDPRGSDGTPSETAIRYTTAITIERSQQIKARAIDGGKWSPLSATVVRTRFSSPLRVTEIMYHPAPPADDSPYDDDDFEFIELQNVSDQSTTLAGHQFLNGILFDFDSGDVQSLGPGEIVLVVKNKAAFETRYDTDGLLIAGEFEGQLNNGGDWVRLVGEFDEHILHQSYSDLQFRLTDGFGFSLEYEYDENNFQIANITSVIHGTPGFLADSLPVGSIVVNEVLASGTDATGDWIELHNRTSDPLDISGWYLSDSSDTLRKFQIPNNTILGAGQYLIFNELTHFGNVANPNSKVQFSLSADGESIFLSSVDDEGRLGGYREQAEYGPTQLNVSMGRIDKADGTFEYTALTHPTKGSANADASVGPVVISEIMHSPVLSLFDQQLVKQPQRLNVGEFVEIQNITNQPIPLYDVRNPNATWRFTEGIEFIFPEGQILPANSRALIVNMDPEIFRERAGLPAGVLIYGPFEGVLRNEGEALALTQASSADDEADTAFTVVDRVDYNDTAPWPGLAKSGSSLERRFENAYANDPANWMPSRFGGSPGSANIGVDERPQRVPFNETFNVDTVDQLAGWQFTSAANSQWVVGRRGSQVSVYRDDACRFCDASERVSTMSIAMDIQSDEPLAALLEFSSTDYGTQVEISRDGQHWTTVLSNVSLYGEVGINLSEQLAHHGIGGKGTRYLRLSGPQAGLSNFSVVPGDVVGPSIINHEFSVGESLESIDITFDETVTTVTNADIRVSDPLGRIITPIGISSQDNITWSIELPQQQVAGRYQFVAMGSITDANGNPLNNHQYSINGRAPDDGSYLADFTIDPKDRATFPYLADFEVDAIEQMTPWAFEPYLGSKWELVDDPARGGQQLRVSSHGSFRIATDLTDRDGTDVTLDFWARSHSSRVGYLSLQIVGEDFPLQFLSAAVVSTRDFGHFALDLDEALANIGLDLSRPFDIIVQAYRGMTFDDVRISDADVFGPRVIDSPTGSFDAGVSSVALTFNEAIDMETLRNGLEIKNPMGMPVLISDIRQGADAQTYIADFAAQELSGDYRLIVRETVTDAVGNPMNQSQNMFAGEVGDSFNGVFTIRTQPANTFPYRQSFENGVEDLDGWSFAVQDAGMWELGPNLDDQGGPTALRTTGGGGGTHDAILALDLSDHIDDAQISLTFLAAARFGRAYGQLYVSGGDDDFYRAISHIRFSQQYVSHSIDLKTHLDAAGIAIDDDVRIKFQIFHAGNDVYLDEVSISNELVVGARIIDQSAFELTETEAAVTVQFDQPIDASTFTVDDVRLTLIETSIEPTRVSMVDEQTFTIVFPRPQSAGMYTLRIGPQILNEAAIPMNQANDAFNGVPEDAYTGNILVPLDPQPIPYAQDFASAKLTDLGGWIFQTINERGNFAGGRWDITDTMNPFGDYHLQATQFSDCWAEHDGILALDYSEFLNKTDMVLEFNMRRTTTHTRKSRGGERNLGKLLIGNGLNSFIQVGDANSHIYDDGTQRFSDLNQDGIIDLVPQFQEYVFYRFDLDQLIQDAGIVIDETLYINFHRTAFFNTDVTLFDNIRVYSEGDSPASPRVISAQTHRGFPRVIDSASITFDQPVEGFDMSDLTLTRNNGPNLLTEDTQLFETRPGSYVLANLSTSVDQPGQYRLSLQAEGSEIRNAGGLLLTDGFSRNWTDERRPGDANLDGLFDSTDFVLVFAAAQYEDDIVGNSTWQTGDWNGDKEFTTGDFVAAFTAGFYDQPAAPFAGIAARPATRVTLDSVANNLGPIEFLHARDAAFAAAVDFRFDDVDAFDRDNKKRAIVV